VLDNCEVEISHGFCDSYSQATAGIALQTFVCLFMQFSLSVEELLGTVEERCTAEWVQSAYTTSEWTSLVLLRCFCTPFCFFQIPLSHFFVPCVLFCLSHPTNPMLSIGILLHAYIVCYCMLLLVLAPVITFFASALMLPGSSLWLVSCVCLHAVSQMRTVFEYRRS